MAEEGGRIETTSSRVVYANRWMTVREDAIRRPDGSAGLYGVVDKPDFALVVPLDGAGGLYLVEQYRYPVGARYWEFPQGSWEGAPAAGAVDPEALARGELAEETGLRAGSVRRLGRLHGAYGFCSQGCDVFVATDLTPGEASPSAEEQDLRVGRFAVAEFEAMVRSGRIVDAPSLAAWVLLRLEREPAAGHPQAPPPEERRGGA